MTMNADIKTAWCAALRDPDRTQRRFGLRSKDGDGTVRECCLGVLTSLAEAAGVEGLLDAPVEDTGDWPFYTALGDDESWQDPMVTEDGTRYRTEIALLPPQVIEWAGLDSPNPLIDGVELAKYNDGRAQRGFIVAVKPRSFAEIADLIEQDPDL